MKILSLLATSLILAGCTTPVAGKWRNIQKNGNSISRARQLTMAFEPDGRITIPAPGGSQKVIGKYSVNNEHLSLESDGHVLNYRYEMTARTLRLQSEEHRNSYLLFVRGNSGR